MKRDKALKIASLTRHQYYHQPTTAKGRGRPKSKHTLRISDGLPREVINATVVEEMNRIASNPDLRCGIRRMTSQLQLLGYVINRKKVAAMMKTGGLTAEMKRKPQKVYVKYRRVLPEQPLTVIEMDIKHVWIVRDRRSAYILNVLDTFTREVLAWTVGFSITSREVKHLWDQVITHHLEPAGKARSPLTIEIRNDNGPQFTSQTVRSYFLDNHLNQVFTHPYTPQENGHIESFHAILSASIEKEFFSLIELENRLHRFYHIYNNKRSHSSIKGLTPAMFKQAWENHIVITCCDKRKVKIKLRYPVYQIPGILRQREHLATKQKRAKRTDLKQMAEEIHPPPLNAVTPVYPLPSVASCTAKQHHLETLI